MTKQWDADDKGTLRTKGLLGQRGSWDGEQGYIEEDGGRWYGLADGGCHLK